MGRTPRDREPKRKGYQFLISWLAKTPGRLWGRDTMRRNPREREPKGKGYQFSISWLGNAIACLQQ